jgi:hypothetical protein
VRAPMHGIHTGKHLEQQYFLRLQLMLLYWPVRIRGARCIMYVRDCRPPCAEAARSSSSERSAHAGTAATAC